MFIIISSLLAIFYCIDQSAFMQKQLSRIAIMWGKTGYNPASDWLTWSNGITMFLSYACAYETVLVPIRVVSPMYEYVNIMTVYV